jgi:hypothetical protein
MVPSCQKCQSDSDHSFSAPNSGHATSGASARQIARAVAYATHGAIVIAIRAMGVRHANERPCAGDYRQNKQPKYVTTAESQQQHNNDPFRPNWGDISAPQGPPPRIEMPVRPIKPPKPNTTTISTFKKPAVPPKPIFGDPFAVDWGASDNEERARLSDDNTIPHQPHRSAPAPPRAPTPPPKDY